jgi:hypothetical protein
VFTFTHKHTHTHTYTHSFTVSAIDGQKLEGVRKLDGPPSAFSRLEDTDLPALRYSCVYTYCVCVYGRVCMWCVCACVCMWCACTCVCACVCMHVSHTWPKSSDCGASTRAQTSTRETTCHCLPLDDMMRVFMYSKCLRTAVFVPAQNNLTM